MTKQSNPGRGGGRNSGKGGRGKGSFYKKNEKSATKKSSNEKKYMFTLMANTKDVRVSTYTTTLKRVYEYLMTTIKERPDDIIESLKQQKVIEIPDPIMKVAEKEKPDDEGEPDTADIAARKISMVASMNKAYQVDFANKLQEKRMREQLLKTNLKQTYTYIFSKFCDKDLQYKIEERSDFESKIENNPITLLTAINELMHTISHEKLILPYETLWTTLAQLFEVKQNKEQKLSDYYETMKAFGSQFSKYFDTNFLDKFVSNLDEYKNTKDVDERDALKKGAWQRLLAYGFLHNADHDKYGRLLNGFKKDYANSTDNFPKTIIDMKERMSISYNESKNIKKKDKNKEKEKDKQETSKTVEFAKSFAQIAEGKKACWICGGDHYADKCPLKEKIQVNKQFKKMMESYYQKLTTAYPYFVQNVGTSTQSTTSTTANNSGTDTDTVASEPMHNQRSTTLSWDNFPIHPMLFQLGVSHRQQCVKCTNKSIILDNGSSMSIFHDRELVDDIRKAKQPIKIATNAGSRAVFNEANVEGFGTVWYDENAIANIFALRDIKNKHRVTYDSAKEDAFIIHNSHNINECTRFKCNAHGIYELYVPVCHKRQDNKNIQEQSHLIDTVKENRQGYTKAQFQRAVAARKLYHSLGAPTLENYKKFLNMNGIQNCPVRSADVDIAENIFGPDMAALKGKSVRTTPKPVLEDWINLPEEIHKKHKRIKLCMDIMYINGVGLMTAVDRSIRYRSIVEITSNNDDEALLSALDLIIQKYVKADYFVAMVYCDREFKSIIQDAYNRLDVVINCTNTNDHVAEAERNNRFLKERFRTAFHLLPYKAIPRIMIKSLAFEITKQANYFPVKDGVSSVFSPRQLIDRKSLDYTRDFRIPFGSYVQASVATDNTPKARTRSSIYLGQPDNIQGGHLVMSLETGKELSTQRVTVIPITDLVIKRVEEIAHNQNFKTLKFKNRKGQVYHDESLIAGVDSEANANANANIIDDQDENEQEDDPENNNNDSESDDDDKDDDNSSDTPESEEELDEEDYEMIYQSNQKTRHNTEDGIFVEDLENIDELHSIAEEQNAEIEEHGEDDDGLEDIEQNTVFDAEGDVNDDSQSQEANNNIESSDHRSGDDGPRRSARTRTEPERLDPKFQGKSYFIKKNEKSYFIKKNAGTTLKRHIKRSLHIRAKKKLRSEHYNLFTQGFRTKENCYEYTNLEAMVMAQFIVHYNAMNDTAVSTSFAQQYQLQKGLKLFGERGHKASASEMAQLHDRKCFQPLSVNTLSQNERKRAQIAMMLLTEKRCGKIKGRMVFDGRRTREWITKEDSASPTATLEGIMITLTIDAKEKRDVMSADVPNAFIQTEMPQGEERVMMKITGVLVDMLTQLDPKLYGPYVVYENGRKVLYVQVLRAIYGMLTASLLWYLKFRKDLEGIGFKFNPYDPCIANRMKVGAQHTVRFHVDDLLSSHVNPKVNDKFASWLEKMYGKYKAVEPTRGKVHDYLGMIVDFNEDEVVKIDMVKYVENMIRDFPAKITKKSKTPSSDNLMDIGTGKALVGEQAEAFHTTVAKGLFLSKRSRPDIQPTIAVLSTRVKSPNESDWKKLTRLMEYLNGTKELTLRLWADNLRVVKWYVDASFAVHPDYRSHTGAVMTLGKGSPIGLSKKQKLNTRSSTEAELVGADDAATMILWTGLFMEEQGYPLDKNILYQDNKSAILLEKNGRRSAGKRSRALNVRYFFLTDQVEKKNLSIEYCPTDEMWADFMTKPLQGEKFVRFRNDILGYTKC